MGFFSRNNEAIESGPAPDVPYGAVRRPARATKRTRTVEGHLDAPPPLDPARTAKTRARRRLIGAIALALAAVVFVPMLFDRAPTANVDDIALQIPDRDTPFEGRRGVPDAPRGPLKGATELPSVSTVVTPPAETNTPSTAPPPEVDSRPAEKVAESPVPAPAPVPTTTLLKPVDKPAAKAATPPIVERSTTTPTPPVASTPADDPKALAALEGKAAAPTSSADAGGKTYAVQVAAFSAADKARGLRDQLSANGMKSYVESVSTSQGLRTRVRLGPFASRDAADRARQKLKTMKLDGSVVPL